MKGYVVYCLCIVGLFYWMSKAGMVPINWGAILDGSGYSGGSSYGGGYHK